MVELATSPRLIIGSGRSGTTWVLDCLADANELRPVFEPLHPAASRIGSHYAYQLMVSVEEDTTLERYFRALVSGQIHSGWIDYRGRNDFLFPNPIHLTTPSSLKRWLYRWRKYIRDRATLRAAVQRKGTLIKCIRANLMAGWLTQTIGFRTALIIRHPGAVVESQIRRGQVWDPTPVLQRYRANHKLHEATSGRYVELLNSKLTTLQALTLNWIIENQWPAERAQSDGYAVIHYEHLVSQPDTSWRSLCEVLDLATLPEVSKLGKPSQQASAGRDAHFGSAGDQPLWRSRMTSAQLHSIQSMLDATVCDLYCVEKNEPLRSGLVNVNVGGSM